MVLCMVMLIGCKGNSDTFTTQGFTEEERVVIGEALAEWCEASNHNYCGNLGGSVTEDGTSSFVFSENAPIPSTANIFHGPDREDVITIFNNRSSVNWLDKLMNSSLHELGHHFRGYGHLSNDNQHIMSPCVTELVRLTPGDISETLDIGNVCDNSSTM